jgi:hypothetical protein
MKQPLMIIPPAQAEALYDAALENSEPGKRSRIHNTNAALGEWDDQGSSDNLSDGMFPSRAQGSLARPSAPLRTSLRPT